MNSSRFCFSNLAILALFMALSLQTALVSWSGKRCVLEKQLKHIGEEAFTCRTSKIQADRLQNIVEPKRCVKSCGLDRNTIGISSDSLLDARFIAKLCSSHCYNHCPNVVNLFFNLAAAEGVSLPKLCEAQEKHVRREMAEIKSSGIVAAGPIQSESLLMAQAVALGPVQPVSLSIVQAVAPMMDHPHI